MLIDYPSIFDEMLRQVPELGVERFFMNLGAEAGPQNPDWVRGLTLYEIYVRAFSEQGTFNGVTERLPELKRLGVDAIWLMPIYPIGKDHRKGTLGSPYAIRDYFNVNPEYGTKQDFKRLVEKAHALNIRVLIDMVPNHVAPDFVGLQQQPHLIKRDAQGKPQRKVQYWTDVADLDYSKQEIREFMAKVMKFWIEAFDVDGYRCDVAGMVPLDFWQWVIPQLREIKPDFYLLAEWESPRLHQAGFNSTYDWSTLRLLRNVLNGEIDAELLANWILTKTALYPQNSLPLRFLENHDLPRARRTFPGESLFAALTLIFSLHGIPLIYNGQEIGAEKTPSLFEKDTIRNEGNDERIATTIKQLIKLRKEIKALSLNQYTFNRDTLAEGLLMFAKEDIGVVINLTAQTNRVDLNWAGNVEEVLFNSQSNKIMKTSKTLNAYQGLIFKIGRAE